MPDLVSLLPAMLVDLFHPEAQVLVAHSDASLVQPFLTVGSGTDGQALQALGVTAHLSDHPTKTTTIISVASTPELTTR